MTDHTAPYTMPPEVIEEIRYGWSHDDKLHKSDFDIICEQAKRVGVVEAALQKSENDRSRLTSVASESSLEALDETFKRFTAEAALQKAVAELANLQLQLSGKHARESEIDEFCARWPGGLDEVEAVASANRRLFDRAKAAEAEVAALKHAAAKRSTP